MGQKRNMTAPEKRLMRMMLSMGFTKDDIIGILWFSGSDDIRNKLLDYLCFKGAYATAEDVLRYAQGIRRAQGERYWHFPHRLFVRYAGETTDELVQGNVYEVKTVYGIRENVYALTNEVGDMREYPASDFERLRPARIRTVGAPQEADRVYTVIDERGDRYLLDDGRECPIRSTEVLEWIPARPPQDRPIARDALLHMLRDALEFGNLSGLYHRMTDDTVYRSRPTQKSMVGREAIVQHLARTFRARVKQSKLAGIVCATVTQEQKDHPVGERFLKAFQSDGTVRTVYVEDDGYFIRSITISRACPPCRQDPLPINALGQ